MGAHAHYLAKDMKAVATKPDGTQVPLLWIPDWDFAWQDRYPFKDSFVLPKGTRIDVTLVYDNSAGNPAILAIRRRMSGGVRDRSTRWAACRCR